MEIINIKLEKFIEEIEKNLDKKAIKNICLFQAGDVPETFADCSLLEELAKFSPKASIEDGIKQFVD